jgi:hypothetical protein
VGELLFEPGECTLLVGRLRARQRFSGCLGSSSLCAYLLLLDNGI